jgi:hypothetical protein
MGLLRTIIILLAIYFLFKLIVRVILPMLIKNYVDKKTREFYDINERQRMNKREGEITIEKKDSKSKKDKDKEEGEYVDYEEVD